MRLQTYIFGKWPAIGLIFSNRLWDFHARVLLESDLGSVEGRPVALHRVSLCMGTVLRWLCLRNKRLRKEGLTPPGLSKRILIQVLVQEEYYDQSYLQRKWARFARENSAGLRDQSPICVPLFLKGMANICLLNICFYISGLPPLGSPNSPLLLSS